MEESITNARAVYDVSANQGISEMLKSLPELAMSQGSYTIPLLAGLAMYRNAGKSFSTGDKARQLAKILTSGASKGNIASIPKSIWAQAEQWK
jgi:hypothetical protein